MKHNEVKQEIIKICDLIKQMLIKKNASYGNSVFEPIKIFSKLDASERVNVRLDDKLSRIARGKEYETEDTELDIIGYMILRYILKHKDRK
jgi:hypothetical protein